MLRQLPPALKRQLRRAGCQAMAHWRRYPSKRQLRQWQLDTKTAEAFTAHAGLWQSISTPVPQRGDATICANRRHNLQLAISTLNNRLILPGNSFSLSQQLGEPTESAGYRAGPVFVRGEVLRDTGGGLCLIATNLYQLFLHAGCRILERHNHSIDAYGEERFYPRGKTPPSPTPPRTWRSAIPFANRCCSASACWSMQCAANCSDRAVGLCRPSFSRPCWNGSCHQPHNTFLAGM